MKANLEAKRATRSRYEERARFLSVEDGFNIGRRQLSARAFDGQRERAFSRTTPTESIVLDQSEVLGTPWPATTPIMLARYIRVRAGESLECNFVCGGAIHVVLEGRGEWFTASDRFAWEKGDVFVVPGGVDSTYRASTDSVLYCVTNEALYSFEAIPVGSSQQVAPVLYPAAAIALQIDGLARRSLGPETPGRAVNLSSDCLAEERTALRSLTGSFNLVLPGESQRPHKHSAAALVLVLQAGGCHSTIGGRRVEWQPDVVLLTPPLEPHTHRNDGVEAALAFIVQDGALHYYTRTMGFAFTE